MVIETLITHKCSVTNYHITRVAVKRYKTNRNQFVERRESEPKSFSYVEEASSCGQITKYVIHPIVPRDDKHGNRGARSIPKALKTHAYILQVGYNKGVS